jgi:hypothetical protein
MRHLLLLLAAGAALGGEPSFDEVFDPAKYPRGQERTNRRHADFERVLKARGAAAAVPSFRVFERTVEGLREQLDKEYELYAKLSAQWWGWRRQHEAEHQKKHGRPPAEYPVPPGLNRAFLDQELVLKNSRTMLLHERLLHEWALEQVTPLLAGAAGRRAIARGLSDAASAQRLRCARLALLTGSRAEAAAAASRESHPGVLAVLAESAPSLTLLQHAAWNVRAGAIRGSGVLGTREAAGWLVTRLDLEEGRLRDDLVDALRGMSGEEIGYDPARWRAWRDALPEDWHAKEGGRGAETAELGPLTEAKTVGVFSDGPSSFFGIRSRTRAAVYCVQASAGWERIRAEVVQSVASLPDGALFGVVAFDTEARRFKPGLVEATPSTRAALGQWLKALVAEPGADPYAGLEAALAMATKGKVAVADTIFLCAVTPPPEGTFLEDQRQISLEVVADNWMLGIRIHAVGPSDGSTGFYLHHLARQWHGSQVNG